MIVRFYMPRPIEARTSYDAAANEMTLVPRLGSSGGWQRLIHLVVEGERGGQLLYQLMVNPRNGRLSCKPFESETAEFDELGPDMLESISDEEDAPPEKLS